MKSTAEIIAELAARPVGERTITGLPEFLRGMMERGELDFLDATKLAEPKNPASTPKHWPKPGKFRPGKR